MAVLSDLKASRLKNLQAKFEVVSPLMSPWHKEFLLCVSVCVHMCGDL